MRGRKTGTLIRTMRHIITISQTRTGEAITNSSRDIVTTITGKWITHSEIIINLSHSTKAISHNIRVTRGNIRIIRDSTSDRIEVQITLKHRGMMIMGIVITKITSETIIIPIYIRMMYIIHTRMSSTYNHLLVTTTPTRGEGRMATQGIDKITMIKIWSSGSLITKIISYNRPKISHSIEISDTKIKTTNRGTLLKIITISRGVTSTITIIIGIITTTTTCLTETTTNSMTEIITIIITTITTIETGTTTTMVMTGATNTEGHPWLAWSSRSRPLRPPSWLQSLKFPTSTEMSAPPFTYHTTRQRERIQLFRRLKISEQPRYSWERVSAICKPTAYYTSLSSKRYHVTGKRFMAGK